jgi:hypothetical protein
MNLLRSICCLVAGRCGVEQPKPTEETTRGERPVSEGDLGQKEAELEKGSEEQLKHMEGGEAEAVARKKRKATRRTQRRDR